MALSTGSQRWLLALALSAGALGAALAAALALSTWPWHLSMALSAGLLAVTSSQSAAGTGMLGVSNANPSGGASFAQTQNYARVH